MVGLEERAKLADHLIERDLPHLVSLQKLDVTEVVQAMLPEHASSRLVRGAALDGEPRLPRVGLNCGRHLCARYWFALLASMLSLIGVTSQIHE